MKMINPEGKNKGGKTMKPLLERAHQDILGRGGDFAHNLKLVTDALPAEAYFTFMEIGADRITVEGETDSPFAVTSYAMALEAQGGFFEVRIAEIGEGETTEAESKRVFFRIIISKQDRERTSPDESESFMKASSQGRPAT